MLGEALRLVRIFHDLKQSELAGRFEISKAHLSQIESGKKTPTLQLIKKYSEEFDLPMSSILFFAENMDSAKSSQEAKEIVAPKVLKLLSYLAE